MASKSIKGITVEIGGDSTGLDKALKNVESSSKKVTSELKEVDRALKNAPDSAVLWAQKQDILTKAIEESKKKLELLEKTQGQVEEQFKSGEIGEEQYRAFQRELENARAQLNGFREELDDANRKAKEAGDSAENAGDDIDKLGDDAKHASEDMEDLGESAEDAGDKSEKSGKGGFAVLAGAITAVATAAGAAIKASDDLSQSYDTLIKKTGATGETLESLKDSANNVFTSLPTDIDSATIAVGEVNTRFAATGEELENLSKKFVQFAEINDIDLNSSIGTTDKIMEQWGVNVNDIDDLLGMLTKKAQDTGISTDALMNSVQENGATFKELGLSLDESINLLAQFEANGVNADTAITGLRKGIKSATDDGKTLDEALELTIADIKNASSETDALTAAQELFGTKGAAEMAKAIQEGRFNLSGLSEDMSRYGGTVSDTYEATISPMEELKTVGNESKIMIGEIGSELTQALLPTAQKLLPKIKDGTDWLIKNLPEIKDTAKKMLPLVEGIGAGFVTWKALNGLKSGIGLVSTLATTIKNMSGFAGLASSGVLGIAGALAVGTGSLIWAIHKAKEEKLEKIFEEGTEKADAFAESIDANVDKMGELKEAAKSQIETDFSDIYITENLYEELKNLVDENGYVKKGYEDRVSYICNELSEATGIEIGLVDGQIQKYQELQGAIEETINKQRAQVFMDSYSATYAEAVKQNATASKDYVETQNGINENRQLINSFYNSARADFQEEGMLKDFYELGPLSRENLSNWKGVFSDEEMARLEAAFASIDTYTSKLQTIQDQYKQNAYDIEMYEKANGAFNQGLYDDAIQYYSRIGDLQTSDLADNEKNTKEKLDTLDKAIDQALREYEAALKLGDTKALSTFRGTLKTLTGEALDGGLTMGDLMSSGIVEKLGGIDEFDATELYEFAKELGYNLGVNVGEETLKSLQPYVDKAANVFNYFSGILSYLRESVDNPITSTISQFRNRIANIPQFATGGTLYSGKGIVAEAGPELLEIINGGVKITPLTGNARNTEVSGAGNQKVFYNTYNVTVEKISSDYDVRVLSQQLAAEQKRIESGKGR